MPNYSLVVNSTFQPFTYQELLAPVQKMSDYHEKVANEYDTLSKQSDILEAMGENDRDKTSGSYSRYKAYSDALRKEADDLYRFGLNTESRRRLSDMRRRYNSEIVPIQNAWNKREKEAEDQMKAQLANPSLMFTRDARNTTLDDYIANPTGGYGVINGANITAQMAGMAKNLAKQIRSGAAKKENIDAYTYNYIQKYGLDENIVRNWQDSPTLKKMFEQVMEANGVTPEALKGSNNMQHILEKSAGYAEMGMWNAMGEDKEHILQNQEKLEAMKAAKELANYRAKKEIDAEYSHPDNQHVPINPMPLRNPVEVSQANKEIQEYLAKGYVKQQANGQYVMTHAGWQEYRKMSPNTKKQLALLSAREAHSKKARETAEKMPDTVPSAFRKFMDAQNGGKSFVDAKGNALPGWGPNRAGNLFAKAIANNREGSYDTYHSTEYDRQIPSEYGTTYTDQVWASAKRDIDGKPYLEAVEFNGKDGWKKQTKKLTKSDLKGYKVTNVRYNKYGDTAILQDGENTIRVQLPIINQTAHDAVRAALANADEYSEILAKGKQPMLRRDANGNKYIMKNYKGEIMYTNTNLTDTDRADITERHRKALDDMELYGSQYVAPSQTDTEKYNRFSL